MLASQHRNNSYLKDSFGYKIKREDDETNIIRFYENFITMNEIFMLDVYNELGLNYKKDSEVLKNLLEVYLKLYFPKIRSDEFKNIIESMSVTTNLNSC